jgi:hypothetical protein
MYFLKLIGCVIVGTLITNYLWFRILPQYSVQISSASLNSTKLPTNIPTAVEPTSAYTNFDQKHQISVTLKNASLGVLTCEKDTQGVRDSFMHLPGGVERTYNDIEEGQYIGCSVQIDSRSSTILNWFNLLTPGVYSFSLERVPCSSCKGVTHSYVTVVTSPTGKRLIRNI